MGGETEAREKPASPSAALPNPSTQVGGAAGVKELSDLYGKSWKAPPKIKSSPAPSICTGRFRQ